MAKATMRKTSQKNRKKKAENKISFSGIHFPRNPVDTSPKFTEVFLIEYCMTTGLITWSDRNKISVGFCSEEPYEVMKKAFPHFHVTYYKTENLFGNINCPFSIYELPKYGLDIAAIEPKPGIKGSFSGLVSHIQKAKREEPLSRDYIDDIVKYINRGSKMSGGSIECNRQHELFDPDLPTRLHYRKELTDFLEEYKAGLKPKKKR